MFLKQNFIENKNMITAEIIVGKYWPSTIFDFADNLKEYILNLI